MNRLFHLEYSTSQYSITRASRHGLEECQCHNREQAVLGKVRCHGHPFYRPVLTNRVLRSILSARSSRSLTERRISHILSVCPDPIPAELPESGLTHMRISVEDVDYADLLLYLPAACRFIDQAIRNGGTVLVHDVQGLSRSATVVAAYCRSSYFSKLCLIPHTLLSSNVHKAYQCHTGIRGCAKR